MRLCNWSELASTSVPVLSCRLGYEHGVGIVIEETSVGEDHFASIQVLSLRWRKQQVNEGLKGDFGVSVLTELSIAFVFESFCLINLQLTYFTILLFGLGLVPMQMTTEIRLALVDFDGHPGVAERSVI